MSLERHPNIHATNLTVGIIKSFEESIRGAASANPSTALSIITKHVTNFVNEVSTELDNKFGDRVVLGLPAKCEKANPMPSYETLHNFYKRVAKLTLDHETIEDKEKDQHIAVVYPSELGKALECVDANWWK
jgi:hypothetical protein